MAINRDGDRYDHQGVPKYRVRVYDAQLRKQVERRVAGEGDQGGLPRPTCWPR